MNISTAFRIYFITTVSYMYLFLFVYAATSKLIDHEQFLTQLGQSPLLTAFAGPVSFLVPFVEFIIVCLLFFQRSRIIGLISAYLLMVLFTSYIIIILNFSSFVPCSCGGILEKMDWGTHLVFNFLFVGLAFSAILLAKKNSIWLGSMTAFRFTMLFVFSTLLALLINVFLFLSSERIVRIQNPFVRLFPIPVHFAATTIDMNVNSYYFAGTSTDSLYLGNSTSPLTVVAVEKSLILKHASMIKLDSVFHGYQSLQLRIIDGSFYLMDGTLPCIYVGSTSDWKGYLQKGISAHFTLAVPKDTSTVAFRQFSSSRESNILGLFEFKKEGIKKYLNKDVLVKQDAAFFDTDGMLLFNADRETFHYIYTYRNSFLTMDSHLQLIQSGRTIDTVSRAELSVKLLENGERILDAPPLVINKKAAVCGSLLFVQSERLGKFDSASKLRNGSIIDVYDLDTVSYRSSIYLENVHNQKMDGFIVEGNFLYYLSGRYLSVVQLF